MSYCQECTERFDERFRFCPDCGTRLTAPAATTDGSTATAADGTSADAPDQPTTRSPDIGSGQRNSDSGHSEETGSPPHGTEQRPNTPTPHGTEYAWGQSRGTPGDSAPDSSRPEANRGPDNTSTQWESTESRSATTRGRRSSGSHQKSTRPQSSTPRSSPVYTQPYYDTLDFDAENIVVGFKYPKTAGWAPTLIGGACLFFEFLLVPLVLFMGYSVRLGRAAMLEEPTAPGYSGLRDLTLDGLRVIGAYLPVGIAGGLLVWAPLQFDLGGLALLAVGVTAYVGGAVLPTLTATGSVLETYRNGRFLRFSVTIDYLKVFLLFAGMTVGLSILVLIAVIAMFITFFGMLLLIPLFFFAPVAQAYLIYAGCVALARAYEDAAEDGTLPSATATAEY